MERKLITVEIMTGKADGLIAKLEDMGFRPYRETGYNRWWTMEMEWDDREEMHLAHTCKCWSRGERGTDWEIEVEEVEAV